MTQLTDSAPAGSAMRPKVPKWKAEWDRLVGDAKGLEIKNWRKYQPEMEDGVPASWFKSYVTTDEDEMADIGTMRWLKDALRRARARRGGPLVCNMDALYTSTACNKHDRQNFPRLVLVLLSCGFLIPCNEQFTPKSREEKKRENKKVHSSPSEKESGTRGRFII